MTYSSSTSGARPSRTLVVSLVITVVVTAVVAIALAVILMQRGSAAVGGTTPSPSAQATSTVGLSPSADASPSSEPSATPRPTPGPLAVDCIARVEVNELNLRAEPTRSSKALGKLSAGARVFVVEGPRAAEGFGWYRVMTVDGPYVSRRCARYGCEGGDLTDLGWVAGVSDSADAWLTAAELACPDEPDLSRIAGLTHYERLACFGNRSLTVEATINTPCCGYVGPYAFRPAWLANPTPMAYFNGQPYLLGLRFDPNLHLPIPERGDVVRVRGHMDDPRAARCMVQIDEESGPTDDIEPPDTDRAPLDCRTEFVVESIDVIGKEDLGPCC